MLTHRHCRLLCLFLCSHLIVASAWAEGLLRQRLRERLEQRHTQTAPSTTPLSQPGDHRLSLQHDGLTRHYLVHIPASYTGRQAVPLLVVLHGGGGSMEVQANDTAYGQISQSEKNGHIAVFPNGTSKLKSGKFATWNAGKCCADARDNQADDVGFIRRMVEQLTQSLNIDRDRIYATGMSNGGMLAYRLACEMADVFSAVAPVAGTDNTLQCQPSRAVSVLHIHARNDDRVLYEGGAGFGQRSMDKVTAFKSVPSTVGEWVQHNHCARNPQRTLEVAGAYCERYSPCDAGTEVQLCVTDTGGHSWPGGSKARAKEGPSQAISANEVMWSFFNRH